MDRVTLFIDYQNAHGWARRCFYPSVSDPAVGHIDVALAVDMVRLAMHGAYDVAILVSADTDLMPAVETVTQLKLAHVELAAWTGMRRLRFPGTQLPWCHFIDERGYRAIEDRTDYTQP